METHKLICERKPKKCNFCDVTYPIDEYTEHIYACGSRT